MTHKNRWQVLKNAHVTNNHDFFIRGRRRKSIFWLFLGVQNLNAEGEKKVHLKWSSHALSIHNSRLVSKVTTTLFIKRHVTSIELSPFEASKPRHKTIKLILKSFFFSLYVNLGEKEKKRNLDLFWNATSMDTQKLWNFELRERRFYKF